MQATARLCRQNSRERSSDDGSLFLVVKDGCLGDKASNIFSGRRIGDDADGGHDCLATEHLFDFADYLVSIWNVESLQRRAERYR